MLNALFAILALTSYSGDLLLVEGDLRDADIPEEASVYHVSENWFLLAGEQAQINGETTVLDSGEWSPDDYALVHLRTPGDEASAASVGEVVFIRGNTALVRTTGSQGELRAYPGVHLVQPLREYREAAPAAGLPAPLSNPLVTDIVQQVNQDSLIATIQHYEDYQTRLCVTDQFYNSCTWTRDKLISYGLTAQVEEFDFTFYGNPYTSWNVIAEQPGLIEPEVIVIICGHLDSITMTNPYETAPGADDNGSGSATVVEAARILSDHNFRYTIRYLCFGAEELGLIGSDFYAQEAAANGDSIIAVMNLDMILYAPDSLRQLFVPYNTLSQELAMNMENITATYVPELELNVQYSPGTTYSDHASFWQQGYPALLGIEQGVDENPWYHQETDLLANYMEFFPFGTECAKAAIATVAVYADPRGEGIEAGSAAGTVITSVGPVPASSALTIVLSASGETELTLCDATGRTVERATAEPGQGEVTMDLTALPAGIYLLSGRAGDQSDSRLVVITK